MKTSRSGGGPLARRLAPVLFAVALTAASCTTSAPTPSPTVNPAYGAECAAFAPDASDSFYAIGGPFRDAAPLELESASAADVGLDEARLLNAADNAALSPNIASLLIVRDGKLVLERYFDGSDQAEAHNVHSFSKSVLALVTGIAIDEGHLRLDSTIGEFLPADVVGAHGGLTVEQLLTMAAGLRNDDRYGEHWYDDTPSDVPGQPSFIEAVLKRESVAAPGIEFEYSTGLTQVLAAVVTEATGQSLCEYAAQRLLGPLGIDIEKWWVEPGGYNSGGHSLFITPREMARLGQLVLQHGAWDGRQLVPSAWLDKALTQRWDLGCRGLHALHLGYGFLWWLYEVDGLQAWNASGFGGQEAWIVPALDMVIVITHETEGDFDNALPRVVPAAIIRAAVLPDVEVPADEMTCPAGELRPHTIGVDGSGRTLIEGWPDGLPTAWSPDGANVIVAADVPDLNPEIYSINFDGTGLTRLTRDMAFDGLADWSPDGARIAFTHGEPPVSDISLVDADGSNPVQLTALAGHEEFPTWSPDGSQIAFVRAGIDTRGYGATGELWVIDADGSDPTPLLEQAIGYPDWSPDGSRIALELRGETPHIGLLELATGTITDLGEGQAPRWSPDGTRLAFIRVVDGVFDIYVMNADGTAVENVTDDAAFDTFPLWSPDGQTLLFLSRPAE